MHKKNIEDELKLHQLWLSTNKTEGKQADFSNKKLSDYNFYGADLREAIFVNSHLHGTNFSNADVSGADFKNSFMTWAKVKNTNFSNANLEGIFLWGSNIKQAILPEKKLKVGNLYQIENHYYEINKTVACLIETTNFNTITLVEANTGKMYKELPSWIKYSMIEL